LPEKIDLVENNEEDSLYYSERNSPSNFGYFFPNLKEGKYVLILNFVESHHNSKNQRVFDINFGFSPIISNLDIYANVGKYRLLSLFIEFELKNEEIIYKVN
jgi:hypothetical protein